MTELEIKAAQAMGLNYIIINQDMVSFETEGIDTRYFCYFKTQAEYIYNTYQQYHTIPCWTDFICTFPNWSDLEQVTNLSVNYIINRLKTAYMTLGKDKLVTISNNYDTKEGLLEFGEFCRNFNDKCQIVLGAKPVNDMSSRLKRYFVNRKEHGKDYFVSTGITMLDECFNGGWDKDCDYVAIVARGGVGKSMFLCVNAYQSAVAGKKVLYYSGEMSAEDIWNRIISHATGIQLRDINTGNPEIETLYNKFIDEAMPYINIDIVTPAEFGNSYPTVPDIEAVLKKGKYDILYLDQQSLVADYLNAEQPFDKAKNISHQLKAARDRLNIPFITAVQQNRGNETKKGELPDLTNIAGTDAIGQDATKVVFIIRSQSNEMENPEKNSVKFYVAKNRNGVSCKSIEMNVDFSTCRFEEAT